MTEQELHQYLKEYFPKENEYCEWKAFSNLKHDVSGRAGEKAQRVNIVRNLF